MKDNNRIVVIDGNSLINRAFYALPPLMNKEGLHTNAVYGFANMLNKILETYEPKYLVVAFDKKAPTFRHKAFAQYKAGRKKMPIELAQQMPLLKELLEYMNISCIELEGFEADDLIGTMVKKGEEASLKPIVITGDKDALQLASDKTQIIITRKGISEFEAYDKNEFEKKYGITPEQFIDLKGLMGDQSDNIPGVPGIGEKTGLKLIQAFGSINNLIHNLDQIKSAKQREKLEDNAQLAVMSRRLAEINVNVPVDIDFKGYTFTDPDTEKLIKFYNKLEFYSLISKIKSTQPNQKEEGTLDLDHIKTHVISSKEELDEAKRLLNPKDHVIIKIFSDASHMKEVETTSIGLLAKEQFFYFQLKTSILDEIKAFFDTYHFKLIGHDLKKEIFVLMSLGIENFKISFDTAIAQYLIQPGRKNYDLNDLALEYFNIQMDNTNENNQLEFFNDTNQENCNLGLQWCKMTALIKDVLKQKLESEALTDLYYDIELPLVEVLAQMEVSGFTVDKDTLITTGEKLKEELELLSGKIYELAKEQFNINSPKQLGPILFEKLQLPFAKKTKTGYSTSVDVLEKLKDKHEIIPCIMEYRTLNKLKTTYIDGLLPMINPKTHKIHAHFNQTVTTTGRISCTEPNLQNIPIKQETGRLLRKAFVAEEDHILMGADYSQIELRILAHLSKDATLIDAFLTDQDIHTITASKVFDVSPDKVSSLQRSNAKAVNFGVIYGMSDYGLSENLHITRKEATQYINEYFKKYATVKEFMDNMIDLCKKNGYVTTIMNRKRHVPEMTSRNFNVRSFGERLAMNTPIQGSAADLIKIAMRDVYYTLKEKKMRTKLILQVHDELILNVHKDEIDEIKKMLVEKMEKAYILNVPLKVDLNSGSNWYELK